MPSGIVNEEAVELTCKALAEVSDGDIVEELELAVRHRDELCARGNSSSMAYTIQYYVLSIRYT